MSGDEVDACLAQFFDGLPEQGSAATTMGIDDKDGPAGGRMGHVHATPNSSR